MNGLGPRPVPCGQRPTRAVAVVLASLLLLGGCAARYQPPPPPPPVSRAERLRRATAAEARALLSSYTREKVCEGASYSRARDYVADNLDTLASTPTETGRIRDAFANGQFRLRLAKAAERKKCFDIARKNYQDVVDVFTGPPYASLRKRATSSLASLDKRAPAPASNGTDSPQPPASPPPAPPPPAPPP